ncbi:BSD domain-containing protein [Flavobacterium croceum DSM 17960]|uniref:BSD domain-containing protein n=1 Tax=Flavobacterium croceum DSM 17960 TaxID=1121886 RepID=A0A2S4N6G7_9FLAO|nr:DUF4268 domain-containing protein [Flavobacterium croceum]POS01308.1 BSD domain-containing protein [Flavobacterium croceum DSM 17960]
MYSKEEAQKIKKDFWIAFAQKYPRKWLLYNTKIKDFSFKFDVDNKNAEVSLVIENKEDELRRIYFEKIVSLKTILLEDYLPEALFYENFYLPTGKIINKISCSISNISVNNQATWDIVFDFFAEKMTQFELFFYEYEDYIRDLEINT